MNKIMDSDINNYRPRLEKIIEALRKNYTTIRAGRINPAILNDIMVSYYGVDTPLVSLANISVPEARQLLIRPFDKSALSAIEKAIYEANIGLTPNNTGESIRIIIPPLTEERRLELVKQVKAMTEEGRIALRNLRHDLIGEIKNQNLSEDEEKKQIDKLQLLIDEYNKKIEELFKEKENDLMTI
ncbi:MAG: ribosome recycling factor [Bacilli bacterium]|jgi:ribosome recycling factor